MSAGTWGGRAIDPRVREAALEAARRHGLQLGGWLGDALQNHDSKEPLPSLDLEDQDFSRTAGKRIAEALERLAQRIEAAEHRSSLAVVGLDRTVVGLASRIEDTDTGAREEALRLLALVGELKSAQDTLLDRLARAEDDSRITELKSAIERIDGELARVTYRLDGDLARLAERLDGTGEAVAASIAQARMEQQQADDRQAARADALEQRLTAFENLREQAHDALHDIEIALRAAIDEADARLSGRIAESSGAAFGRIEEIGDHVEDLKAQIDAAADSQAAALADVEQRVTDATQTSLDALDARLADTLADLRASVKIATDRATVAESSADAAARALGEAAHLLTARIDAVVSDAAETATRVADIETTFDARVTDLASSVDSLRGALDAAFASLRPDDIEATVSDVNRRMAAAEGRQAQTIEAVSVEIKRLSEALDRRMRLLEDAHQKSELPKLIDAMQAQTAQRFGALDNRAAETSSALAARFDAMEGLLAAARADLRREIETTVAAVDKQLQARLDGALDEIDARLSGLAAPQKSPAELDASLLAAPTPVPVREPTDIGYREDTPPRPAEPAPPVAPAAAAATTTSASWDALGEELDLDLAEPTLDLDEAVDPHTPLAGVHDPDAAFDFLRQAPPAEPLGSITPGFDDGFDTPRTADDDDDIEAIDDFETSLAPALAAAPPLPNTTVTAQDGGDGWDLPDSFDDARDANRTTADRAAARADADPPVVRRPPPLLDTDPDLDLLEDAPPESPSRPQRSGDYLAEARRAAMAAATPAKTRKGLSASPRTLIYGAIGVAAATAGGAAFLLRPAEPAAEQAQAPPPTPQSPVSGPPGSIAEAAARQAAASTEQVAATAEQPAAPKETLDAAAARGDSIALYELARRKIAEGTGDEGFDLMKKAADKGLAAAQYRLAKLYERGEGAPADIAAARTWTERAAMGGNRAAMHDLGVYYARGEGVALNEAQAFRWFRQAADLGMTNSQFNLGVLYQSGRGVAADPAEALFWYTVAGAADDSDARSRATALSQRLDPAMVAQVRARAAAFRPKPLNPRANGDFGPQTWAAPPAEAVIPGRT